MVDDQGQACYNVPVSNTRWDRDGSQLVVLIYRIIIIIASGAKSPFSTRVFWHKGK
jgi:hypothetical protein